MCPGAEGQQNGGAMRRRRAALVVVGLASGLLVVTTALSGLRLGPVRTDVAAKARADTTVGGTVTSPAARTGWARSLAAKMPADLPTTSAAACARTSRPAGWLARENALPGTPGFNVPASVSRSSGGYLDQWSLRCGDVARLHLSGPAGKATVSAYRLGWYGGAGARLVWRSGAVAVAPQPQARPSGPLRMIEERWPVSLSIPVTTAWTPGFYMLLPRTASGASLGAVPFVVRNDAGREPLLVKASILTWLAYNDYGGTSLYDSDQGTKAQRAAGKSLEASLARPFGPGAYRQILATELPLVPFVERLGLDVGYTTDLQVDARPSLLLNHAALVSGGHSEYWTRRMYDGVEAARNHGVNLAFLGANNVYWQMRLASGPGGSVRGIVYRRAADDPLSRTQPASTTTRWTDAPLRRNASPLLGQTYAAIRVRGDSRILRAPGWLFHSSGASVGTIVRGLVGRESDGTVLAQSNPPTNQVLAESLLHGRVHGKDRWATSTVNYYTAPSGAAVFAAGSMYWVCQLDGSCASATGANADTGRFVRALTENLLRAMASARAGVRHPSRWGPPLSVAQMQRVLPSWAIGSIG